MISDRYVMPASIVSCYLGIVKTNYDSCLEHDRHLRLADSTFSSLSWKEPLIIIIRQFDFVHGGIHHQIIVSHWLFQPSNSLQWGPDLV